MQELVALRSKTRKVFDLGNREKRYRFHLAPIHYEDGARGAWRDIDTAADANGVVLRNAAQVQVPQFADGPFLWSHRDHHFDVQLVGARNVARVPLADSFGRLDKGWRYPDAMGSGFHLDVRLTNQALHKAFVLDARPSGTGDVRIAMELLDAPLEVDEITPLRQRLAEIDVTRSENEAQWHVGKIIRLRGQLHDSYIWQAKAWDSRPGRPQTWPVPLMFYERNARRFLVKIIPRAVLDAAVYPLYFDDPVRYDPTAGDGMVSNEYDAWDTIHDATDGAFVEHNVTYAPPIRSEPGTGGTVYGISRGFFPIDTSGITDTDTVTAADLNLFIDEIANTDNDGDDFFSVVQTSQASTTTLGTADYDQCGATNNPTEGSERHDVGVLAAAQYNTWALNATGLGWINKTGVTLLGGREGHDQIDVPVAGTIFEGVAIRAFLSERAGTTEDPWLDVTTSAGGATLTVAGTLTSAGALTKRADKALAGTLTTAGTIANIRTALVALAGTLTSSGIHVLSAAKLVAGTLTSAGALTKRADKSFAGTLASAGTLATVKTVLLAVAGTLATAGSLTKRVLLTHAGTLTSSGVVTKSVAKVFAGTLTLGGTAAKQARKLLVGVAALAGTLANAALGAHQPTKVAGAPARFTVLGAEDRPTTLGAPARPTIMGSDD